MAEKLESVGLSGRLMVDCSHANSGKDHEVQASVVRDLAGQIAAGSQRVFGVMLESFLVEGNQKHDEQKVDELIYGQSITDACMGWEQTEASLEELAAAARKRRG